MKDKLDIEANVKMAWETFARQPVPLILGFLIMAAISAVTLGICAGPMVVGYNRMLIAAFNGGSVAAPDVLKGFENFIPALALMIVSGLAIMLGTVFFVLPGLIAAVFLMWAPWVMANGETGVGACIRESIELTKQNILGSAVILLLSSVLLAIGSGTMLVILLTGPLSALFVGAGFRRQSSAPRLVHAA